jgi:Flp pilus assembly protein TadG
MRPRRSNHQRGAVIVWMALFILAMLMFVALGVDTAKLMVTRTQLQNAADAAALAGASAVNSTTGGIIEDEARARAAATAAANKAFQNLAEPVVIDPANDVVIDQAQKTVTVTVHRDSSNGQPMVAHFAQVVGMGRMQVKATATAQLTYSNSVCRNLVPLAVQPNPGETFETGCAHSYIIKDGGGAGTQGQYGGVQLTQCDNGPCAGMNPSGANTFQCLMENGFGCCMDIGNCINNESGNMSGPVRSAISTRFSRDTDQRPDICYAEGSDPYHGNGQRVVTVPITSGLGEVAGCSGYRILRFASFFIRRIPGNGGQNFITAEFIDYVNAGSTGGNSGTAMSIRLIR